MPPNSPSRVELSTQACDICRKRKVKCYRTESRCTRCERLNLSCTFLTPSRARGPKKRLRPNPSVGAVHPGGPWESVQVNDTVNLRQMSYPTDDVCERSLFKLIMEDFLDYIYILIPIVHRPSFRSALMEDRDREDSGFLGLTFAIAAVVVATLPSRFQHYRAHYDPLRFRSRQEMVDYCADRIMRLRTSSYFDEINFQKFAISYLLYIAFLQLGNHNRSRMLDVEAMQLARLLNLHCISRYDGLNCIETQLRKKGFWLIFYTFVHARLQNMFGERLSYLDPVLLRAINPEDLMPLEVADEYILENEILEPDSAKPCVVAGFIIHSRVFWAAIRDPSPGKPDNEPCPCVRAGDPQIQILYLRNRLDSLKYLLHDIPPILSPWGPSAEHYLDDGIRSDFATMRANLHVTHIWLQSLLIDQLEAANALVGPEAASVSDPAPSVEQRRLWLDREELCRQLFFVLHALPPINLEANGLHLAYKVRDVAAGLLTCPFLPNEPEAKRAADYVQHATDILSRLDQSECVNTLHLQSWVDTDRCEGV
ncbi:beta-glucosidase [Aspergillus avenaceus]|uniref:Beta-glucosidase n=1 Tax=Aspergillus avenaceus TaxID=36643 RepID=A0A5N6U409_ASPAV|nr:beta-glucosidase [Aspergillus avenaceus]